MASSDTPAPAASAAGVLLASILLLSLLWAPIVGFLIKVVSSQLLDAAIWALPLPRWLRGLVKSRYDGSDRQLAMLASLLPVRTLEQSTVVGSCEAAEWFVRRLAVRLVELAKPDLEAEQLSIYRAGGYLCRNLALVGIMWIIMLCVSFGVEQYWPFSATARWAMFGLIPFLIAFLLTTARYCGEVHATRSIEYLLALANREELKIDIHAILQQLERACKKMEG
ncbi:hypothetical protein KJ567_05985 [Candidatus Bipolaricaulota bacterium]|nr:hypothetical protein [Candidatus Bipolaricaulota bacterium]